MRLRRRMFVRRAGCCGIRRQTNIATNRRAFQMKYALHRLIIVLVSAAILGCGSAPHKDEAGWIGHTEKGLASFYADKHQRAIQS
jgi:hypothetical protein